MRQYLIQFLCAAVMALALAGCSPRARDQAREAGGTIAERGREAVSEAKEEAADAGLAGKVQAALKLRQGLDVRRIDVKADARQGRVTLEGSVPSMQQRRLAEEVARTTDGVHQVVNQLAVPPGS